MKWKEGMGLFPREMEMANSKWMRKCENRSIGNGDEKMPGLDEKKGNKDDKDETRQRTWE